VVNTRIRNEVNLDLGGRTSSSLLGPNQLHIEVVWFCYQVQVTRFRSQKVLGLLGDPSV
jgi:hypothetical protein